MKKKRNQKTKPSSPPVLKLSVKVLREIIGTIGLRRAESGGILGGAGEKITHYHYDDTSKATAATYTPDHISLTNLLQNEWSLDGAELEGFVHSHPRKSNAPSLGDKIYAERILECNEDMDCLWLPIVNTIPDTGSFSITPWAACRSEGGVRVVRGEVQILALEDEPVKEDEKFIFLVPLGVSLDKIEICKESVGQVINKDSEAERDITFERVKEAYDLSSMRSTRIIAVGAGGAAEWFEQMARAGVGQFVLIDPDTVSKTNLATQQTYLSDVGRPKVDCIEERIKNINPAAKIITIQKKLEDLSDEMIRKLALGSIGNTKPEKAIICGLTDKFEAQAQVNRIALQLGIPSLCAQVYQEGRGAEITFTYPGVTPACHRCILSSRYQYYLKEGNENNVTSHGTPIFATTMLNAIKGYIALALIHHGSEHKRWGKTLTRIGNRNLVQIRLCPDISDELGIPTFDKVFENSDTERLFFGEPVWLPQEQECPETGYPNCPDCGGTGDLRDAIGSITDTRFIPPATTTEINTQEA